MQFDTSVDDGDQLPTLRVTNLTGRGFSAIQRTLPGILRSFKAIAFRFITRTSKQMVAIHEQIAGNSGMNIAKVGQHEYFGIMEDVAMIAKACQAFSSNT